MRIRHYWNAIIVALCCSTIKSCPPGFFEASDDTCLTIAKPGMSSMDEYCLGRGSKVFGRPVTEDIAEKIAEEMVRKAKEYMPQFAYLGMKKKSQGGGGFYSSEEKWSFEGEDAEFDASDYKLWLGDPSSHDCAVTGPSVEFKAVPYSCQDKTAAVCQKIEQPCYHNEVHYADYRGLCLVVMAAQKTYDMSNKGCKDGRLVHMKAEENQKSVKMAFYNNCFAGGVYVGLRKKGNGNGAWEYANGEKLKGGFAEDDKMDYDCGGVRVLEDLKTLALYTIPCDGQRLHYMCEVRTKGKY